MNDQEDIDVEMPLKDRSSEGDVEEKQREPWNFTTVNVCEMLQEAYDIASKASPGSSGVTELEVMVAVNHLRHAAAELERSMLEKKYGVKRR